MGVWLGSPSRKLPRTPAVFDRKTKWKFQEITEEERGDWQRNYSSLREHAELVQKQFEAEEAAGVPAADGVVARLRDDAADRVGARPAHVVRLHELYGDAAAMV